MKRKPKFLIVVFSAIITFATLLATIGKPPYAKHHLPFAHCENSNAKQ